MMTLSTNTRQFRIKAPSVISSVRWYEVAFVTARGVCIGVFNSFQVMNVVSSCEFAPQLHLQVPLSQIRQEQHYSSNGRRPFLPKHRRGGHWLPLLISELEIVRQVIFVALRGRPSRNRILSLAGSRMSFSRGNFHKLVIHSSSLHR